MKWNMNRYYSLCNSIVLSRNYMQDKFKWYCDSLNYVGFPKMMMILLEKKTTLEQYICKSFDQKNILVILLSSSCYEIFVFHNISKYYSTHTNIVPHFFFYTYHEVYQYATNQWISVLFLHHRFRFT